MSIGVINSEASITEHDRSYEEGSSQNEVHVNIGKVIDFFGLVETRMEAANIRAQDNLNRMKKTGVGTTIFPMSAKMQLPDVKKQLENLKKIKAALSEQLSSNHRVQEALIQAERSIQSTTAYQATLEKVSKVTFESFF